MARISFRYSLVTLGLILFAFSAPPVRSDKRAPSASDPPCIECLKIRIGLPVIEQGPGPGIPDNPFSEIQLPNGRFRGFSASATSYAIDGKTPWDMRGKPVPVLGPAPRGKYGESGKWLNHVESSGKTLFGWVHDETGDAPGQGVKSMSFATSEDIGLHWQDLGQIIVGTDSLTRGRITGEGDCTVVNGQDGYYYAYCWRNTNGAGIVARAPVSDPRPGKWKKYYEGKWDQPGVRGQSTGLAKGVGGGAARWTTTDETLLLGWTKGGMGLQFSANGKDFLDFAELPEPLMVLDNGKWNRPDPSEVIAYQDLIDAKTGSNQLSNSWIMTYTYLQPNEGFDKRYLVFRSVDVSIASSAISPQVGILLARWFDATLHDRWATTAAVPSPKGSTYKLDKKLGYLMTVAGATKATVKLEDCVSQWPGHPDHMLEEQNYCNAGHYKRLRTAGWVYSKPEEGTVSVYRCYNAQEHSHFASNQSDCENLGKKERLLGYALSQ